MKRDYWPLTHSGNLTFRQRFVTLDLYHFETISNMIVLKSIILTMFTFQIVLQVF